MRLSRKKRVSRSRCVAFGNHHALYEGAGCGDLPRVRSSIKDGASVNAFDVSNGVTVLCAAAAGGRLRICRMLLKLGASPNTPDRFGKTPLMAAAEDGYYDICKLLLSHKADPSKKDYEYFTALHLAAHGGHTRTCILLIENGADVNAENKKCKKAYDSAYNFGKLQTAQLLKSMEWLADTVGKKNAMAFLGSFGACVQ